MQKNRILKNPRQMDTVRVEGFSGSLRGRKIWIVGEESLVPNRLHVLEQELLGRGKRVLIQQDGKTNLPRWAIKMEWDAYFRIRDSKDLQLALTYVVANQKPMRVVWIGDEPQPPVLQKLHQNDVSIIGFGTAVPRGEWEYIFFSSNLEAPRIEDSLLARMGSARLSALNLRSVIPELRAVRAGLVWTNVGESEKTGTIYWYDVGEGEGPQESFDPVEAAAFLRDIAEKIGGKGR